jgi:hypothetical protein
MSGLEAWLSSADLILGPAAPQGDPSNESYQQWNASEGVPSAVFYREDGGYLVRFPDIADFHVAMDGRVRCIPVSGAEDRWHPIFQQQILPLIASLHGPPVYHGASVAIDGCAVAFIGASGRGKSTLTAAFASRGFPFLADDCLRVVERDGMPFVQPDLPSIRLWDDSLEALAPADARAEYATGSPKAHLQAMASLPHAVDALPLARLYVIGGDAVEAPIVQPMSAAEAAMAWTSNAFLLDIKSPEVLRRNFSAAARLAGQVPARRLEYPRRYEMLDALVAGIAADVRG